MPSGRYYDAAYFAGLQDRASRNELSDEEWRLLDSYNAGYIRLNGDGTYTNTQIPGGQPNNQNPELDREASEVARTTLERASTPPLTVPLPPAGTSSSEADQLSRIAQNRVNTRNGTKEDRRRSNSSRLRDPRLGEYESMPFDAVTSASLQSIAARKKKIASYYAFGFGSTIKAVQNMKPIGGNALITL